MPRATFIILALLLARSAPAAERSESFDREPAWVGSNNRPDPSTARTIRQDFGYSRTSHAGREPGEIGGLMNPAGEPAYYAKKIATADFKKPLVASGSLACTSRQFHVLVGFFNSSSVNEWRTPNSIAIRLMGRGDIFYAYVEYATAKWRAGGDSPKPFPSVRDPETGRDTPKGFPRKDATYQWSLRYDPTAAGGRGAVFAQVGDQTAVCELDAGHKQDGATFDRFGLLNVVKSADDAGEVWLDNVTVNGERDDFSRDPGWDGFQNRRSYKSPHVRPRFDFGFSPTNFAGGRAAGEIGGLVYRGDCREPSKMAFYADKLAVLTPNKPLRASGKIALRRGVSDSAVLIGFFDSRTSTVSSDSQANGLPDNFLGISTDAPSREGFYFAPTYRFGGEYGHGANHKPPHLYPDGKTHDWTLQYLPTGGTNGRPVAGGEGCITATLDGRAVHLPLGKGHRANAKSQFDRFGIITTWIDGNSQTIYFDDLTYTVKQE
jgi:hypothetical protein